jgi:acetyl esterase/lipase
VAIIIHGGCWVSKFADLQNTAAQADALRDAGIATRNIEYRRNDDPGGGWPGTFHDVARAADHLREIAGKYNLDLKRVVAMGHSAGGHLALWLAARARLPKTSELYSPRPLPIAGVVVNGGPGDLEAAREHMKSPCGSDVISALMGGGEQQVPQRYAQGSPVRLLPLGVPQIFLSGEHDQVVPANFADDYGAKARAAGDRVQHEVIAGAGHHEYNAPTSVAFPAVKRAVLSLLEPKK